MEPRINKSQQSEPFRAMLKVEQYLAHCAVEKSLLELVRMRVSQINHCAYCIDMHWKDARAAGESEQRLYGLPAWRESPYYTARERAALAWAESVTLVAETGVPDDVFAQVSAEFSEDEIVDLTWAVMAINAWNRLNVAMRTVPGTYQAPAHKVLA
ncbi:MAG TPA: carboxymuconolactone decarboxylase family protein [Phycisphaerae bacterium]|nr:carboxymuconolactone decarboxylase family protein [Phycisphaerales bacterium]HRX86724.1 carboxymuconolactone decarboxylase family protein [Phycisphaerae bacterium]